MQDYLLGCQGWGPLMWMTVETVFQMGKIIFVLIHSFTPWCQTGLRSSRLTLLLPEHRLSHFLGELLVAALKKHAQTLRDAAARQMLACLG